MVGEQDLQPLQLLGAKAFEHESDDVHYFVSDHRLSTVRMHSDQLLKVWDKLTLDLFVCQEDKQDLFDDLFILRQLMSQATHNVSLRALVVKHLLY
jgi:hypothetical protein